MRRASPLPFTSPAATPSGFWIAVNASASPATICWYWPMPSAAFRNETNRPVEANMTPAITAPAIRPIPATYAIASTVSEVKVPKDALDTVPWS